MLLENKASDTELSGKNLLRYGSPALIGLSGGLFACATAGFTPATLLGTLLLTVAGALAGWNWRQRLRLQNSQQDHCTQLRALQDYSSELEKLFLQVTPILVRQVQTSRCHTEQQIAVLTGQFAALAAQLEDISAAAEHLSAAQSGGYHQDAARLSASCGYLRGGIDAILVAFQFQDRVSQLLAQVENNLACLQQNVQTARQQDGMNRAGTLDIERTLQQMKLNYALPEQHVNHRADAAADQQAASGDELTFF